MLAERGGYTRASASVIFSTARRKLLNKFADPAENAAAADSAGTDATSMAAGTEDLPAAPKGDAFSENSKVTKTPRKRKAPVPEKKAVPRKKAQADGKEKSHNNNDNEDNGNDPAGEILESCEAGEGEAAGDDDYGVC